MPAVTPTDAELQILQVLWDRGASTVREVHDRISKIKPIGYTTVLKQMQVMHQKRLVSRSERFRSHVYESSHSKSVTQRRLAGSMLRRVFDNSARGLLQSALAGRKVDTSELQEIRDLLKDLGGSHDGCALARRQRSLAGCDRLDVARRSVGDHGDRYPARRVADMAAARPRQ
jgi:BlaI family transcriptional regulator, penicillinase repressor